MYIPYEDSIRADERRKFAEWIEEYYYVFRPGEDAFTLYGDVHYPSAKEILDEYEEYEECEDKDEDKEERKAKMFWDSANGCYTTDDSYCPVYKGEEEGVYIETWNSVYASNLRIDFAFTQMEKDYGCVARERDKHFEAHNFRPFNIVRMILPPKFYEEMYKQFISDD